MNHLFATAAPSTVAASPDPAPTTKPHNTTNSQYLVATVESPNPALNNPIATTIVRRNPKR
ncbi:MAG: hypothetical protein RLZZ15_4593 [Verrucomicrobiota bacterium]|jgi:hypothetical protein